MTENNEKPVEPGRFIVIEGIDGAGTTTQSKLLSEWLASIGRECRLTSEPSRGPVGVLLRQILSGRVRTPGNDVISLLFAADRIDHLENEILPSLQSGSDVVSDRYYHSSFTYQSLQGDLKWIRELNSRARVPDVTYILELPADLASERRRRERTSEELYEQDSTQQKLEEAYRRLPRMLKEETIVEVDGRGEIDAVFRAITADLEGRLHSWSGS
jgi:dTMP kinase